MPPLFYLTFFKFYIIILIEKRKEWFYMNIVYLVDENFENSGGELVKETVGIFESEESALNAIRALRGKTGYEGEYTEYPHGAIFSETDDFVETNFQIIPFHLNKLLVREW